MAVGEMHLRPDIAGAEDGHIDIRLLRPQLFIQTLRQCHGRVFGTEIGGGTVHGDQTGDGADIQDLAVGALGAHLGQKCLHHEPMGVDIGFKHPFQVFFGHMLHIGQGTDARVVYQYIHPSEFRHDPVEHGPAFREQRDIRLHGKGLAAHGPQLCGHGFGLIAVDIDDRNIGSSAGKSQGQFPADAVAGAGDDDFCVLIVCKHDDSLLENEGVSRIPREQDTRNGNQVWGLMPEASRWIRGCATTWDSGWVKI